MRAFLLALLLLGFVPAFLWSQGMMHGNMHGRGMMGGMMGPMMGAPPSVGENPLPASAAVLERGRTLYAANCAVCHGDQGRGDGPAAAGLNPPPPGLRGRSAAWSDGQLAAQILQGRGTMPGFSGVLEDEGVWSIVHYLRRLQG